MLSLNNCFQKLPGNYLFSEIAGKVKDFTEKNPEKNLIRLGIGDVTRPLVPAVINAMQNAVAELASASTFKGYGPDFGYDFLVDAIVEHDYVSRGVQIEKDEIFVSDGCKSDSGNIGDIFGMENKVAICDPVYPVYVDTNVMAGRAGEYDEKSGRWSNLIYLPCNESNEFIPQIPELSEFPGTLGDQEIAQSQEIPQSSQISQNQSTGKTPDIIYLCFPNNPSGTAITYEQLAKWVDYAKKIGAVILYDAAYEAFISEDLPHSIYEIPGAKTCAIELKSYSKTAGFTGVRCGYTVVPKELVIKQKRVRDLWARRQATKFNGVSYITQKGAAAIYTVEGKSQIRDTIAAYMENATILRKGLQEIGFTVYGGVNAPYIWMKTPRNMTSWDFFDYLLKEAGVVGTPGSGFGPCGERFFRLTAFGTKEDSLEALQRIKKLKI